MPKTIITRIKRKLTFDDIEKRSFLKETDELTGLLTSGYFYDYASSNKEFLSCPKMDAVTVNINHFHLYNELYGMNEGDQVLKLVGGKLKKFADEKGGIASRSEADNFSMYLPHQDSYEELANDILKCIQKDFHVHNTGIRFGINDSIDQKNERLEMAFDRARSAGDAVDKDAKKMIVYYDSSVRKQRMFEERLLRDIHEAIAKKQFKVLYQPKYDVTEDLPILKGAEALVRWEHPELGTIYPSKFISLFEEHGLIQLLDDYVWRKTAKQIREWKDKYKVSIPVSVNVSRIDIQEHDVVEHLLGIVKQANINVSDLHLEITESACATDTNQLIETVKRFRENGFIIEMDDFGSGYSSLNMLTSLPIDVLKVDMRFMENIKEDRKNVRMVELVKEIADFLKVPVVAEGVEQQEQLDTLKELGCQMIQGYYFSKPVGVQEFETLNGWRKASA